MTTASELEDAEREITHAALVFLKEAPVSPAYNLGHLCAIHRRIFGDIYDWAGQLRTVAIAKGGQRPRPACLLRTALHTLDAAVRTRSLGSLPVRVRLAG